MGLDLRPKGGLWIPDIRLGPRNRGERVVLMAVITGKGRIWGTMLPGTDIAIRNEPRECRQTPTTIRCKRC